MDRLIEDVGKLSRGNALRRSTQDPDEPKESSVNLSEKKEVKQSDLFCENVRIDLRHFFSIPPFAIYDYRFLLKINRSETFCRHYFWWGSWMRRWPFATGNVANASAHTPRSMSAHALTPDSMPRKESIVRACFTAAAIYGPSL